MRNKLIILFLFLAAGSETLAQDTYIIEGDTVDLKREVSGTLNLLWTTEGNRYRYFVQKKKRMVELKNIMVDGVPQYRAELDTLTADASIHTRDVNFALYSLKHFVNQYNKQVQEDYVYNTSTPNFRQRLGFFTGLSNNVYTTNPENILAPIIGMELEVYDPNLAPRHSAIVHLRQSFKREELRYSSTQLSLSYRFKVLRFTNMDIHVDAELATAMYSENTVDIRDAAGEIIDVQEDSGFSFKVPLNFGIGTDILITDKNYITFGYNDFISLVLDDNGSFPLDFTLGYKYHL